MQHALRSLACSSPYMDEKDFKKHLQDLAHGHHHPEEHDWNTASPRAPKPAKPAKPARRAKRSKA
jgi:hypothetical protein